MPAGRPRTVRHVRDPPRPATPSGTPAGTYGSAKGPAVTAPQPDPASPSPRSLTSGWFRVVASRAERSPRAACAERWWWAESAAGAGDHGAGRDKIPPPAPRSLAGRPRPARFGELRVAPDPVVPSRDSDLRLLERIALGERDAFQELYSRYAGKVLAYVRMLSRDSHAAEDVVQEVFLAVWRKAASFQPERGDAPTWLYTITRNKLVDHWRRRGPLTQEPDFDLGLLADERAPGATAAEARLSVRQALTGLSRDQRQAVELAYFGGLTYEETARRLELPVGTLKSRIRAGLAAMRATLGQSPEASA